MQPFFYFLNVCCVGQDSPLVRRPQGLKVADSGSFSFQTAPATTKRRSSTQFRPPFSARTSIVVLDVGNDGHGFDLHLATPLEVVVLGMEAIPADGGKRGWILLARNLFAVAYRVLSLC